MDLPQIGVAAPGKCAQQVERGGRLRIGAHHTLRIVAPGFGIELDPVDIVAEIARQRNITLRFRVRAARFGELARHPPDFHHRHLAGKGHHHRHLQQHAESVADIVGVEFGKAFRAVATLQQEALARRHFGQVGLQRACLTRENQRRIGGQRGLCRSKLCGVVIGRQVPCLMRLPAVGLPILCHCLFAFRKFLRAHRRSSIEEQSLEQRKDRNVRRGPSGAYLPIIALCLAAGIVSASSCPLGMIATFTPSPSPKYLAASACIAAGVVTV